MRPTEYIDRNGKTVWKKGDTKNSPFTYHELREILNGQTSKSTMTNTVTGFSAICPIVPKTARKTVGHAYPSSELGGNEGCWYSAAKLPESPDLMNLERFTDMQSAIDDAGERFPAIGWDRYSFPHPKKSHDIANEK